ncbi:hypothetical protein A9995_14505 [Erythrobacter sp. QSSC1-22B]|uniref:DUF3299 domain-containing protein n=1 Tax=Erythrobacter sp. QSSC1-22B TaxID=1860125 RepID=UPI000805ACF6|nr:DUF3299 domain-containing protein [Erythrobacter sp. QSSC1-22B]OBX17869.1 hypothetical protein A9995_14505 [Erythrobacter sp. QSSC1-22B]
MTYRALTIIAALLLVPIAASGAAAMQRANVQQDVWRPAATPKGGVSWAVLESTKEIARKGPDGYLRSKPSFTAQVKRLDGKRVKVAGWMDAFEPGRRQTHFLLMAYPPGCPFHFHAAPNQYIEVKASSAFPLSGDKAIVVTGVLELTGYDESGIFYVLKDARPG